MSADAHLNTVTIPSLKPYVNLSPREPGPFKRAYKIFARLKSRSRKAASLFRSTDSLMIACFRPGNSLPTAKRDRFCRLAQPRGGR